jgi:hypothetical protein
MMSRTWTIAAAAAVFGGILGVWCVSNYETSTKEQAHAYFKRTTDLSSSLAMCGQLDSGSAVFDRVDEPETIGMTFFGADEKTAIFSAISTTTGSLATPDEKLSAMHTGLIAEAGGMDREWAIKAGINFAYLDVEKRFSGGFKESSDDDFDQLARMVTANLRGTFTEEQLGFLRRFPDKDEAIKLILGAAVSHQGMGFIEKLEDAAATEAEKGRAKE